jgi:Uma2 family endonuclease
MVASKLGNLSPKPRKKVPDYLIYEIIDGKPIHYRGYRAVLAGKKSTADIMGSSTLQSFIISYLQRLLLTQLDEDRYLVLSNELGLHLDRGNNLAGDIVVFETSVLPPSAVKAHYADVPPRIVIEVDLSADPADMEESAYLFTKTQKLLNFGVEKVVWIVTGARKVSVASATGGWKVEDWGQDIELIEGISFNIGAYLQKKGVEL